MFNMPSENSIGLVVIDEKNKHLWLTYISNAIKLLDLNRNVLDKYVLDFFTEDHWSCLKPEWQEAFMDITPQDLSDVLKPNIAPKQRKVWPLSLLCYRAAASTYSLPRRPVSSPQENGDLLDSEMLKGMSCNNMESLGSQSSVSWGDASGELTVEGGQHRLLQHVFRRHLKPKKQHEVSRLALVASEVKKITGSDVIVDVGSGQGHLSRLLAYGYHDDVFCLDSEDQFINGAKKFDSQLEISMKKYVRENGELPPAPSHGVCLLTPDILDEEFMEVVSKGKFRRDSKDIQCGLLGLHTCGDLATTLLQLFCRIEKCRSIISVPCCYMKLSTERSDVNHLGYPLSASVVALPGHQLTYEARGLACHALEIYTARLQDGADNLKVHCYRATLEEIIVKHHPNLHHAGLRSVNNAHKMTFPKYATEALSRLKDVQLPFSALISDQIENNLSRWMQVVVFYSIRLMLAPVVESVILLDRILYLYEKGIKSILVPIFDPKLSPRNFALIAVKNKL